MGADAKSTSCRAVEAAYERTDIRVYQKLLGESMEWLSLAPNLQIDIEYLRLLVCSPFFIFLNPLHAAFISTIESAAHP